MPTARVPNLELRRAGTLTHVGFEPSDPYLARDPIAHSDPYHRRVSPREFRDHWAHTEPEWSHGGTWPTSFVLPPKSRGRLMFILPRSQRGPLCRRRLRALLIRPKWAGHGCTGTGAAFHQIEPLGEASPCGPDLNHFEFARFRHPRSSGI